MPCTSIRFPGYSFTSAASFCRYSLLIAAAQAVCKPAADAAQAVCKAWIGSTITGKGWRIVFDGDAQRTRVIFDAKPTAAQAAAVDAARFYYSPSMGSYNKHLTCKAYKAAQALAQTLAGLAA